MLRKKLGKKLKAKEDEDDIARREAQAKESLEQNYDLACDSGNQGRYFLYFSLKKFKKIEEKNTSLICPWNSNSFSDNIFKIYHKPKPTSIQLQNKNQKIRRPPKSVARFSKSVDKNHKKSFSLALKGKTSIRQACKTEIDELTKPKSAYFVPPKYIIPREKNQKISIKSLLKSQISLDRQNTFNSINKSFRVSRYMQQLSKKLLNPEIIKKNKSKILKKNNFLENSKFFQNEFRRRLDNDNGYNININIKHKINELSRTTIQSHHERCTNPKNRQNKQRLLRRLLFS